MKKFSLIAILFLAVLLLQNCKKDTVTGTTTSTEPMIAIINDSTWTTTNVTAAITYNSATKTKVLTCVGTSSLQQVNLYATQNNAGGTPGFALATYSINSTSDVAMSYDLKVNNVFTPQGVVGPGSGVIVVTAVDSVKKVITGTFTFNTLQNNYDTNGNIVSVTVNQINDGGFNEIPYTFTSN